MSHQESKEAAKGKSKRVDHCSRGSRSDCGDLADQGVRHHRAKADTEAVDAPAQGKHPELVAVEHDGEADNAEQIGELQHLLPSKQFSRWKAEHNADHLEEGDQAYVPGGFLLTQVYEVPVFRAAVHVRLQCEPPVDIVASH